MSDEPNDDDKERYGLVCPFLDTDPRFAYGVAFGQLIERLREIDEFSGYELIAIQEQITLYANRTGWTIDEMEPWEPELDEEPQWFLLKMHRKPTDEHQ